MNLDFDKMGGLIPAIIQDNMTNKVLMLGFMNEEAYQKTLETNKVVFYSRTKQRLWMKGETSGNTLQKPSRLAPFATPAPTPALERRTKRTSCS